MGMTNAGSPEINATPLIDVLLVLLIIFIVLMPIMLSGERIELPPKSDSPMEGVTVALKLDADLSVAFDEEPAFPSRELPARLRTRLPNAKVVFVDFVASVPWQAVVATVDTVRGVANDVSQSELPVAVRLHGE
jgi:biopolymer transport protein ExbD